MKFRTFWAGGRGGGVAPSLDPPILVIRQEKYKVKTKLCLHGFGTQDVQT